MTGSTDASRKHVHCLHADRPLCLMQLPDELLGRIISSIEDFDCKRKVLAVVCHRFCRLLRQPVCGGVWRVLRISLSTIITLDRLFDVLLWAYNRRRGITAVRIPGGHPHVSTVSASAALQAAAAVLDGVPLELCRSELDWDAASWPESSLQSVGRVLTKIGTCAGTLRPADGDWNRLLAMEALTEAELWLRQPADAAGVLLPVAPCCLNSLRRLDLNECGMDLSPLFQSASSLSRLTCLSISHCRMSEGVLSALPQLMGLRDLSLCQTSLAAVPQLSAMSKLTRLELVPDLHSPLTAADVQDALCKQTSLVNIVLDDSIAFTPEFVGVAHGLTRVTELDIYGRDDVGESLHDGRQGLHAGQLLRIMTERGGKLHWHPF